MGVEPDEFGNILDLPLTEEEEEDREVMTSYLTEYLIRVDEGKVRSIAIFSENVDGTWGIAWTRTAHNSAFAAKMLQWSLQKLGMVEQDELVNYVRRDGDE